MKKRIHLLLLSLILVFSIFPACGVSAKELYDFQIGFTNKAGSTKNSQSENTGSDGVSSPRWVLVNTSYDVVDDKHYGGTNVAYSFEGDSDGTVRFKRSGGIYKDARNYYRSDVYYECMKPPATLTPGQPITLTMKTTVENYEHASTDGTKPGVHADSAWIQDAAHFKDVKDNNNTYLVVPVTGNTYVTGEFAGTASTRNVIGSNYEIKFCINNTGTYTWTYELQNISENAGSSEEEQSSAGNSGPRWVLVNTSYDVADDKHYGGTNVAYSFEGDSDGTVRFKRSGGIYKDARNYYRSDVYYECMKPPATLTPGQPITLTMKTTVENYEHASTDGTKPGVHADSAWIQDAAHFKDVKDNNNTYLVVPVTGNTYVTGEFTGTASTRDVTGSNYEIKFCINNTGTYTWTYELQDN